MANPMSQPIPQGNMHILQGRRNTPNGSPKMAPHQFNRPIKSSIKKAISGARTGDAVSDDSEEGDQDVGDSANHGADTDADEPDGHALSGAPRVRNNAAPHLAGLTAMKDIESDLDEQATAGAESDLDEEDYGDVEDASDGDSEADEDEEEETILRSAEKDLIEEFEHEFRPRSSQSVANDMMNDLTLGEDAALARRLSLQTEDSQQDELEVDLDFTQDPFGGLATTDDLYNELVEDAEHVFESEYNELSSWRQEPSSSRETSAPSTVMQKKVRFEETTISRSSSMSSEDDPREAFPDLFDARDGHELRQQMLLNGLNVDAGQDNESTFEYDFEDEFEAKAFEIDGESDSDSEMSETDSDDGDTTDEETPDEQLARIRAIKAARNKSVPANTPISAPSTPVASDRSTPVLPRSKTTNGRLTSSKASHGRPKIGTFAHDPTRAAVTADVQGSGIKVTCPTKPPEKDRAYWNRARQAMSSRDGSPGGSVSGICTTPRPPSIPQRPFTARSTLGTMFDGNLDFLRNNDDSGIAKDILTTSRHGSMRSSFTSNAYSEDEASDMESDVDIAEFVQVDDSDLEMEEELPQAIVSPVQNSFNDAFHESSPMHQTNPGLIDHFDQQPGLVSSFRNNQNFARHLSSLAANPVKRAQTLEANALQKGRRAAANTPITPARKSKANQDFTSTGAGIKKVSSPLIQKHRRSRGNSLSGIHQTLALDRYSDKIR